MRYMGAYPGVDACLGHCGINNATIIHIMVISWLYACDKSLSRGSGVSTPATPLPAQVIATFVVSYPALLPASQDLKFKYLRWYAFSYSGHHGL